MTWSSVDLDKAMIGDGDAVRIAAQVLENLLGPGTGWLAVDQIDLQSGLSARGARSEKKFKRFSV